jgi:hypothetical protein
MADKHWISTSSTSFNTAGNWSDGVAPANGDTLRVNHLGTANIATNLGSTLTTVTLIVEKSYLGQIGSLTSAGVATYLTFDGGTIHLEQAPIQGSPAGSSLLMIANTSTTAMTVNVYDSASSSASTNYPPILLKGTDLTINHYGGKVGLAALTGETATATINVVKSATASIAPELICGNGTTITALKTGEGAYVLSRSNNTCASAIIGGTSEYEYQGTGAHTALEINDTAKCYASGTGTVTAATVRGGTLDFSRDTRAKTYTDLAVYKNSTLKLDNGVRTSLTFTNALTYPDGLGSITFESPAYVKMTFDNI